MYYITLGGRNYNIAIKVTAGFGGVAANFSSRLESCNGPIFPIDCDVDITYYYEDIALNSGLRTVTLLSGSSTISDTPTGYQLTTLYVDSTIGYGCTSYNTLLDCPAPLPVPTTTTTTTSTTTTTTTAGITPESYPAPIIKYDQYSSSFGPGGNPIWPNIGTGGSTYNLSPGTNSTITAQGSGIGSYLKLSGGIQQIGPVNDSSTYWSPALTGNFLNLENKSFSYAMVFRLQNSQQYSYISYVYGTDPQSSLGIGFNIVGYISENFINTLEPSFFAPDSGGPGGEVLIAPTSKWYLGVFTFDKNASYQEAQKFYLNVVKYDFTQTYSWSPSTWFNNTGTWTYKHVLAYGTQNLDVAAAIYWDNVVLSQAQVQNLFNEYNSRYTLG